MQHFGTDGVRGEANRELTPELAFALARAATLYLCREASGRRGVVVGKDPRWSGAMLEHAVVAGILSAGAEAWQLGVVPTPAVAFAVHQHDAVGGVMISASHNPFADNGIKFFDAQGYKLAQSAEMAIESSLHAEGARPVGSAIGQSSTYEINEAYLQALQTACPLQDLAGMRIVVDAAHGATAQLAPRLLRNCGAEVIALGVDPDGKNINEQVGSTHPAAVQAAVRAHKAELGLALDGDGDRLLAVDAEGGVADGDHILAICALDWAARGLLAHHTLVTTVMSNGALAEWLAPHGISLVTTQVGDREVMQRMREGGYTLGGEASGHVLFFPASTTGDGLLTLLQLLRALQAKGTSLQAMRALLPKRPQQLISIPARPGVPWETEPAFQATLQAAEQELAGRGRILIRPSGTEPLLRVMVEAPTAEEAQHWTERFATTLRGIVSP